MIARNRYSLLLFTASFFIVGCGQTFNPYLMLHDGARPARRVSIPVYEFA